MTREAILNQRAITAPRRPPVRDIVKRNMTEALTLIQRREGHFMYDSFRFLLTYLGKELNLHNEPLGLNRVTIKALERHIDLDSLKAARYDVLGDIFMEQRLGSVSKGQYFTPIQVVKAMVAINQPKPGETILDPACGSGRFLLEASKYTDKLFGIEIDLWTYRMCLINMALYCPTAKILCENALTLPEIGVNHPVWNEKGNKW